MIDDLHSSVVVKGGKVFAHLVARFTLVITPSG
jgi:hypothetical protein